jgi:DNA end-binding protein Ku
MATTKHRGASRSTTAKKKTDPDDTNDADASSKSKARRGGSARPSARAVWSGAISFGLVTIPVKLFTAVREKRIAFRSLHDQDKVPLRQKLVCPADGKEVHPEHIVKGYQVAKDQYVVIRQEELDAVAPKATKAIDIVDFVDLTDIDPMYFDRPYHVAPAPEGAKPYKLLVEAMQRAGKVAIGKVVMHNKEYLAALRPLDGKLCLETMHFGDEVVSPDDVPAPASRGSADERELKVAEQLIASLTTRFNPARYKDEYREKVLDLVERKAAGEKIVVRPAEEKPTKSGQDLVAALEASLARARSGATGNTSGNGHRAAARPTRTARHHAPRRRKSA